MLRWTIVKRCNLRADRATTHLRWHPARVHAVQFAPLGGDIGAATDATDASSTEPVVVVSAREVGKGVIEAVSVRHLVVKHIFKHL